MIDKNEIDDMAANLGIHTSHVQRDYVHSWVLSALYSKSKLSDRLVLKGGNCLRKGYFEQARYSRDIDFTTSVGISNEELECELNAVASILEDKIGVVFDKSKTIVEDKKRADSEKKISEAKLFFKDFYGVESQIVLGVRLDVTQFDKIYLPIQDRVLVHPYSDSSECATTIRCVKLEEILATKMRCLLQRKHIADLYDLVYATIVSPEIEINRQELVSTFFRITIFGSNPSVAKGLFIDLPLEALGKFWTNYITCPNASRFKFEDARNNFIQLIENLIPGRAEQKFDRTFFPSSMRNPILEAADSQKMLRMIYSNMERLIEPYELTFKIRKDGIGREYLYAYDTTGGASSAPGLKTFVSENVQKIELTDIAFEPKYEIETKKAGGAETVSRFTEKVASGKRLFGIRRPAHRIREVKASSWGIKYQIVCPYCNKRFNRDKLDTKLNKHTDRYGNPCYGKVGYLV